MKNKKSAIKEYFYVIAIVVGISIFFVARLSGSQTFNGFIGEYNFYLTDQEAEAQKDLFYIDQSAEYALEQSVYELSKNGGFSETKDLESLDTSHASTEENEECGKFRGSNVWYSVEDTTKSCIRPVKQELEIQFNENLNGFLSRNPNPLLLNNYEFKIQGALEIIGIAFSPLTYIITKKESPRILEFSEINSIELDDNLVRFRDDPICKKGVDCVLDKEAFDLLGSAQAIANSKGVELQVTSAFRTLQHQHVLWERNPNPTLVCRPSKGCPHTTAKAVDIRFKHKTFDTMTRGDWNTLNTIMTQAGWVRYSNEPWHFECCGTSRYLRAQAAGVTEIV